MITVFRAMPEATLLYSVAGVVIAGLVLWVAWVLKTQKEPWARGPLVQSPVPAAALPAEPASLDEAPHESPDSTSRATPMALSEGRAKASEAGPDGDSG
jgi:hypothetical protein